MPLPLALLLSCAGPEPRGFDSGGAGATDTATDDTAADDTAAPAGDPVSDGSCGVEEGPPPEDHLLGDAYWSYPVYIAGTDRRFVAIQEAIWGAEEGDTVVVKPGTYTGTVDLLGKAITLCSEQGAALTVLDAQGEGPVVRLRSWEPAETLVQGFTITGGVGEGDETFGPTPHGGGVFVKWGSPTLRHNVIVGNQADIGGGVYARNGAPTIENNIIAFNSASQGGGGLTCSACRGRIAYNHLVHNQAPQGPAVEYFWGAADFVGNLLLLQEGSEQSAIRWLDPRADVTWTGAANLLWPARDLLDGADDSEWPGWGTWTVGDPLLAPVSGSWDQDWHLPAGSAAIDCGPEGERDVDGSRADCGGFGGAYSGW